MAKDLPYFKFFCSEWSDGDITLETYETQGLFINICAYYWSNECVLELSKLKKRFRNEIETVDLLLDNNLLKQIDGFIKINFLDEQKFERNQQSKIKSIGGKASAEAKRLAKIQQTVNTSSTESQHVLKFCSTESQVLREEERREEKKREEKKREEKIKEDSNETIANILKSSENNSWLEVIAMQNKKDEEWVKVKIDEFLIFLRTQIKVHKNKSEFVSHFTNWLPKKIEGIKIESIKNKTFYNSPIL